MIALWRKLSSWKARHFLCTPRWYSYGGMFSSIFLAVNLSRFYGKSPLFFYPKKHFDRRYNYPAMLNRQLSTFVVEGRTISDSGFFQRLVSFYLDFCRTLWRNRAFGEIAGLLNHLPLLSSISVFPHYVGYSGVESSSDLSRLLGISEGVDWKGVFKEAVPIDITDEQKRAGEEIKKELGMNPDDRFVCLYVRDQGFESRRTSDNKGLLSADITNFIPVISFLQSAGYYVVRVGEPTMAPLTGAGPKFIDYVHTEFYSELMDLYFIRNCAFWIGTMGGGRHVPIAYRKSCVLVNGIPPEVSGEVSGYCINEDDVYLSKHVYSNKMHRFLSLQEQLDRITELGQDGFWESEYIAVENTSEEIYTAVDEFYSSKFKGVFDWDLGLQTQYWDLQNKRVREALFDSGSNRWQSITIEQTAELQPHISQQFLENCWDGSDYLDELTDYYNQHGSLEGFQPSGAIVKIEEPLNDTEG